LEVRRPDGHFRKSLSRIIANNPIKIVLYSGAITFVVANCIRLRSISPKHLEFQRATTGYSMPYFRRFAIRLFTNAIYLRLSVRQQAPLRMLQNFVSDDCRPLKDDIKIQVHDAQ